MNRQPASLKRRFAALVYESLMVAAVAILAGIFAGIVDTVIVRTVPSLASMMPIVTTGFFLYCWWFYFKINWVREAQTLPMRVWRIELSNMAGERASIHQLRMRFVWAAVFLVFIPLFAYYVLRQITQAPVKMAVGLALLWWLLPWGFALFNPRRQFLYDYLAGTQLLDTRQS